MVSFSHIINPVSIEENVELFETQKLSFASILKAKNYNDKIPIELFTVSANSNSLDCVPVPFKQLPKLDRTISDLVNKANKNYPILSDIFKTAQTHCKSDYIIFTNLDIALMPYFYEAVNHYVSLDHDAIIINRRRIKNRFKNETTLEALYAEAGKDHTGYDTFIIKRDLLDKFIYKNIAIGVPPAGNDIFYNIFAFAQKPILFTEKHLTFHVGLDLVKNWGNTAIVKHNYNEFHQLLKELKPVLKADNFPGAELGFFARQFKWLMNPTFHYPTMLALDLKRGFKRTQRSKGKNSDHWYYEFLIKRVNFEDE